MNDSGNGSDSLGLGAVVDGRYRLDGALGEGGMGVVFRAFDLRRGVAVALKVLHQADLGDEDVHARFEREAQLAAKVDARGGVVRVHALGWHGPLPYLAMELVEGKDLAQVFGEGDLEPARLAEIVASVARTLHQCHEAGVVHRDLKPSNVLLPADGGRPRVVDFGLARGAGAQRLTHTGAILGTPQFMAPEQALDAARATAPTIDVYQLGAILYQGLAGVPPFHGGTLTQVLLLVASSSPTPPRQLRPSVPPELEGVCLKAMQRDPAQRYPTALALAEDLGRYCAGQAVEGITRAGSARLLLAVRRAPRWARYAGGAAIAVALAAAALAWTLSASAREARRTLAECRDFDARVVAPHALGLGRGAAPQPATARGFQARLLVAREGLTGEARAEAERLSDRLASLVSLQSGRPRSDLASTWARVAAALVHRERGEARLALEQLRGVNDFEFPKLRAVGRELARALIRSELERAATTRGPLAGAEPLARWEAWLGPGEAAALKAEALRSSAPAWASALERAKTRGDVVRTLERLLAVAPAGPCEALVDALTPLLRGLIERWDRGGSARGDLASRIYELAAICSRFAPGRGSIRPLRAFLQIQLAWGRSPESVVLSLGSDAQLIDQEQILGRVDRAALEDLSRRWPWSRAIAFCRYLHLRKAESRSQQAPGGERALDALRRVLKDSALVDDLGPAYLTRAGGDLASRLLALGVSERWTRDDPRWGEALEAIAQARVEAGRTLRASRLTDLTGTEVTILQRLRGYEAGLKAWETYIEKQSAAIAALQTQGEVVPVRRFITFAQACQFAGRYAERKDPARALRFGERALRTLPSFWQLGAHAEVRALVAQQHLAQGSPGRALEVLEPLLSPGLGNQAFALATVRTLRALGKRARARACLREALKANPDSSALKALAR